MCLTINKIFKSNDHMGQFIFEINVSFKWRTVGRHILHTADKYVENISLAFHLYSFAS